MSRNGVARTLAGVTTAATAGAGAAWLLATYIVRQITAPVQRLPSGRGFTPFETGATWEEVSFTTEGGTRLPGWLLARDDTAPAILACGGYRGERADLLGISSSLWRAGFSVLLFDYRGHGHAVHAALRTPVTLGYRELADAQAALRYLRHRRPHAPLGAIGFSMGASVALMLAAREPDVRCVVADSPFTSQREIVRHGVTRRLGRQPFRGTSLLADRLADLVLDLVDVLLQRRFGFRFDDVHPLRDATRLVPRPLLLIHGEDDEVVPASHARRIAAAAGNAGVSLETWFVPDCDHCGAYFLDRPRYCGRVAAFFRKYLHT
ncbi:MAG: hypothetical protein AVDCRST_MAG77-3744 [uncultured Chloroflexi bacterium]|uniref:AB hydrolase-1 domain-containing protein n=1 Tax=uncultured Chloroflexota bacterium TaxID=166587 RepID=A0A6J4J4J2_9CHLR|nr:MAG: hypothetical protein AVDCRST_MAG77-3744 [uncultured Chloroflexota bacterium]